VSKRGEAIKQHYILHPEKRKQISESLKLYFMKHPEARKVIAKAQLGVPKPKSKEFRKQVSNKLMGHAVSLETRLKISKSGKGKHNMSNEQKRLVSLRMRGKKHALGFKHSSEAKAAISKFQKANPTKYWLGKKCTEKLKKKLSKIMKGRPPTYNMTYEIRKKISEGLKKSSLVRRGKNHPCYIDGRTEYPSIFNKELKYKIFSRDFFTCQVCGNYPIRCQCHHIDYNKQNCKEDNLITVCCSCNNKANFNRDYWFAYFKYIIEYWKMGIK
jgi:hypothetical protein